MQAHEGVRRRDSHLELDGDRLFVREVVLDDGPGATWVLFVHGNTFPSIADFDLDVAGRSVAESLAGQGIRCCLFDHRGYGRSSRPSPGVKIGLMQKVRDLEKVYEHLRIARQAESICLFGVSTGCNTIVEFLSVVRAGIDAVVMVGPCYLMTPHLRAIVRKMRMGLLLNTISFRGLSPYMSFSRKALAARILEGEEDRIERRTFDRFVDAAMAGSPNGKLTSPVLACPDPLMSYSTWQRLFDPSRIDLPTLLVRGERDEFCCERTIRTLARDMGRGNVEILVVPGVKHDIHLYEGHEAAFASVRDFIVEKGAAS